ncbi:MAG: FHA domain-containing protein [bacterium]
MATQDEIIHLNELLNTHKENLRELELQAAKFGPLYCPVHITNGIKEEKVRIKEIEERLKRLKNHQEDVPGKESTGDKGKTTQPPDEDITAKISLSSSKKEIPEGLPGEWILTPGNTYTIGRPDESEVDIDLSFDNSVTREHAQVWFEDNSWWIRDKSRYGTKINEKRSTKGKKTKLTSGDKISMGNETILVFEEATQEGGGKASHQFELSLQGFKEFVKVTKIRRAETLISNMAFSQEIISKAQSELPKILTEFKDKDISVILCGSFSRLEASRTSDADFFAIFEDKEQSSEAIKAMIYTANWFDKEGIDVHLEGLSEKLRKDCQEGFGKGRFPTLFPKDELLSKIGSRDDSDEWKTRRITFLTESVPLYNPQLFNEVKESLSKKYLSHLAPAINQLPKIFLEEFRGWHSSVQIAPDIRPNVGSLFRVKAECLRRFTCNSLLIAFGTTLIQGTEDVFKNQLSILDMPPIIRFLYSINNMPDELQSASIGIIKNIVELYNDTLKILSDKTLREYVERDLPDKETEYIKKVLNKNGERLRDNLSRLWNEISKDLSPQERFELFL